ncbi:TPA: molecular chaperone [Escherichia coli]
MKTGALARWSGLVLLALLGTLSGMSAEAADGDKSGIGTDRTRYIFNEGMRQTGVTLSNRTHESYLVQAWVRGLNPQNGEVTNASAPFFLKQPLVKALPDGRYGFQVIQTRPVMVKDRESLYLLSFKLIPAEKKKGETGYSRANVVLTYNVKLFYRPAKLKDGKVAEAAKSLRFRRKGDVLQVSNPTPYWITFYSLKAGGHALSEDALRRMVPPLGEAEYPLPSGVESGQVTWRVIDENGEVTKEEVSAL